MSPAVTLGAAWGALVGAWLWASTTTRRTLRARPIPTANRIPRTGSAPTRSVAIALSAAVKTTVTGLGRAVRRRVLRDAYPEADLLVGVGLVAGAITTMVLHPVVGLAFPGAALAWSPLQARRTAKRRATAVGDQLPDVIDLLRLTTLAGLPVSAAVVAIGSRPGGVVGTGLQRAARQVARGAGTADALVGLTAACGHSVQPLVDVLVDHDRYGTPLGPALDRVSIESRLKRRRQAEEAARRLPVTLLFPLVLTTLPACVLLTVVPLVVASLSSLT